MKKIKSLFIASITALTLLSGTASAASVKLSVNGTAVTSPSFIQQGITFFGLRELLNALGVGQIKWDAKAQTITAVKGNTTVNVTIGKKQVYKNGMLYKELEVPARSIQNKVYLPARAVAEAFGYSVSFKNNTVVLTSGNASITSASTDGIATLSLALDQYAGGIKLNANTKQTLSNNQSAFFGSAANPLSLDKIAKSIPVNEIARDWNKYSSTIVNFTFLEIDSIRQIKLSNGKTVTGVVAHAGGKYREMTESWEDSVYFQIFYFGTAALKAGDSITVNGIPVGSGSVDTMDTLGRKQTEPMTLLVAGNLLSSSQEYDIRSTRSQGGSVVIPELQAEAQKKMDSLQLTLSADGLKIFDPYLTGMEIKSVQIQDYTFTPTAKTIISNNGYEGLMIPLSSFLDAGSEFQPTSGSFFIRVVTDRGETTKFIVFKND
ncbi:copper amine oxidase N-terminal domain-containing protein [Paenibacillus camerounensis]|uniref:copper amine oxidase N-terminal domain-containing protein n=1 Tax=Paenibacillus camerounensis TaxID=1243663 RepID=UPI0005A7BE67|nr:copper amine oxidase N-terminal domain-containing protein [Paenibacillus camerounensis]